MARESDRGPNRRGYFKIIDRSVDLALSVAPVPLNVLDVGCGDGTLLRELIERVPYANQYVGVDSRAENIEAAKRGVDERLDFVHATPAELPFPAGHFDLIVSSMSFASWPQQLGGLKEITRVLTEAGQFVLVDELKPGQVLPLIAEAGLTLERRETLQRAAFVLPRVRAYVAVGA